jgi:uncharacterized membrane protein YjfL (UPF0719 family)
MDYKFVGASAFMLLVNLAYAAVAILVGIAALRLVDLMLFKKIDFEEEVKKGNLAAGIFGAALIIFVGLLISRALGR